MKKISTILVLAIFSWSISACNNRNGKDINNDGRDGFNHDTMVIPPLDTTNNINKDTLGMRNIRGDSDLE